MARYTGSRFDAIFNHVWLFLVLFIAASMCGSTAAHGLGVLIAASVVAAILTLIVVFAGPEKGGSYHVVIRRGDTYTDLGPGTVYLGFMKYWYDALHYNPRSRTQAAYDVRLQMKDGSFVIVDLTWMWKPDPDKLADYFAEDWDLHLMTWFPVLVQQSSKRLRPAQLFGLDFTSVLKEVMAQQEQEPAVVLHGPFLANFRTEDGRDISKYIRDNSSLIESIIDEIEDEDRIATVHAYLDGRFPDRKDRIERLIGNRLAVLKSRGLRENR